MQEPDTNTKSVQQEPHGASCPDDCHKFENLRLGQKVGRCDPSRDEGVYHHPILSVVHDSGSR